MPGRMENGRHDMVGVLIWTEASLLLVTWVMPDWLFARCILQNEPLWTSQEEEKALIVMESLCTVQHAASLLVVLVVM